MPPSTTYQSHARFEADVYGPRIVIPPVRPWPLVLFLLVWLSGWGFGEYAAGRTLLHWGGFLPLQLFILVWLAGWTVAGGLSLLLLLFLVGGRQVVSVAQGNLIVRGDIFGLGITREYDLREVENLRVQGTTPDAPGTSPGRAVTIRIACVAFDYRGKTRRIGGGLPAEELQTIAAELGRYVEHP